MKKYHCSADKGDFRRAIEKFYRSSSPDDLMKIASEVGLLDKGFENRINIAAILKLEDPFEGKASEKEAINNDSFASIAAEVLLDSLKRAGLFDYEEINLDFVLQSSARSIFQRSDFVSSVEVEVEEERGCQLFSLGAAA